MVTSTVGWTVSGDSFRPRRFGIVVWVWSAMEVADADEAGPCKDKVDDGLRGREKRFSLPSERYGRESKR